MAMASTIDDRPQRITDLMMPIGRVFLLLRQLLFVIRSFLLEALVRPRRDFGFGCFLANLVRRICLSRRAAAGGKKTACPRFYARNLLPKTSGRAAPPC